MFKEKLKLMNSLLDGHVFYGLHMSEGTATYRPPDEDPFTVFVGEQTIKLMNSTFPGKPVYVGHTEDRGALSEADGVVCESFYNPHDGKHWCKFVITTQKGLDAINRGWQLSNSFVVDKRGNGGEWHGSYYDKEVLQGTYDHLAIVSNPRYSESKILTPKQYKEYNQAKKDELLMLENSKEENPMKLQFWKKEALKNEKDLDLENMSVTLPKSKKEKTIVQLVNEADELEVKGAPSIEDAVVSVGDGEMKVSDLVKLFLEMKKNFEKAEDDGEEAEETEEEIEQLENSNGDEDEDDIESDILPEVDTDEMEEADAPEVKPKLENSKKLSAEEKKKNLDKLRLANSKKISSKARVAETTSDQVRRGKERYSR